MEMKDFLNKLFTGHSLDRGEAEDAMRRMVGNDAPPEQIAAFLGALRTKKETVDEIVGFATVLRDFAVTVPIRRRDLIDTAGTGGDGAETFNISTTTAFVLAGAGLGVAKHGNRSVSSRCGSADVLETLGIRIDLPVETVARAVDENGFGFLFAPNFHPALKKLAPIRKAMGVRTVFNLLAPLLNPARVRRQILGIYDVRHIVTLASCLRELGVEEAMVLAAEDGLDELSLAGKTTVAHLKQGRIELYMLTPEDAGLSRADKSALRGGDAKTNAEILIAILKGAPGPMRDAVLYNAGAALMVAGKASNIKEGVKLAAETIDSGDALKVLEKSREVK